ncbi:basic proline-rich protein-like [Lutra lutra]|uniref:basic proline-rich protein-like n=1 Tax=Lutra lutra TaxID=9657 RepID=UPI001FD36D41|nr:basic proline-rich protein-like [Lutra lutra]
MRHFLGFVSEFAARASSRSENGDPGPAAGRTGAERRPGGRERSGGRANSSREPAGPPVRPRGPPRPDPDSGGAGGGARGRSPYGSRLFPRGFDLPRPAASAPFPEGECAPPAPRPAPHIVAGMLPPLQACRPRVSGPGSGPAATGPGRLSHHCRSPNPPAPGSRAQTHPSPSIPFFVTPPRHNLEVPSSFQVRADVKFRLAENLVLITKFPTNALNGIKNRSLLFVKEKKNPALRKIKRLVLSSIQCYLLMRVL